MMRTVNVPIEKLRQWLGEDADIHDLWMTCDPIAPELVVVVKSDDTGHHHHSRGTDQFGLEAALDRTMMNHA